MDQLIDTTCTFSCQRLFAIESVNYGETFSPMVKFNSIHVIFALAIQHALELHQFDVKTTFLNSTIDEEIYMAIPKGLEKPIDSKIVCKLLKALYGLKQ
jgi:hypothetical protein